ncbi:YhbD family protein [Thermaerobacillus caldiproteolyticus]|uniref:DNA-binding transcriptional MerR regulator n=1 Tax=Thermaerobacillus caldiproteolyticus TaxID=247480 RepID=A0A7W0C0Z4_9BACL|nr:YhbD family protein [Anoxybacillus caldiproteolyticus]MBA2876596.1 DNA-binding transcriptional MerR regulator [Anoxybacillus caldiproteolyticus]QPA32144.1 YhbD family protein [Anoxybacillus caldiproteolyticus]
MEQELISKKELLELTGISYGQLYRWKRKKLIPEEWFIRKSTFTGQETFFPKEKILSRIEKIKNMKDDLSLDELASMFSPNPAAITLSKEEFTKRNIVSLTTFRFYIEQKGEQGAFSFAQLLQMYVLEKLLQTGDVSLEEGKLLLDVLENHYSKIQGRSCELLFIRKMGISIWMLVANGSDVYFEEGVKVVVRLHLPSCIEELKMKISEG